MRHLLILFITNMFLLHTSIAQTVGFENEIKNWKTGEPYEYLGEYKGNQYYVTYTYFVVYKDMLSSMPEEVSKELSKVTKDNMPFMQIFILNESDKDPVLFFYSEDLFNQLSGVKSTKCETVLLINDSLTVVYSNVPKGADNLQLFAARIPLSDLKNPAKMRNTLIADIKVENTNDKSRILVKKNRDGSKIEFYNSPFPKKKETSKIYYGLLNVDATGIKNSSFTTDLRIAEIEDFMMFQPDNMLLDYFVSKNGTGYFAFYLKENKEESIMVFIHSSTTNEIKKVRFTSEGQKGTFATIAFAESDDNKTLISTFIYNSNSSKEEVPVAGVFGKIIDNVTLKETAVEPAMFDKDNFKDFDLKWDGNKNKFKDKYIVSLKLLEPIVENNNVYLTGTNYFRTSAGSTNQPYSVSHWHGILAVKFNFDNNKFEYLTTIPMAQSGKYITTFNEENADMYAFTAILLNNKLYIVLNDNNKNINVSENNKIHEFERNIGLAYKFVEIDEFGAKSIKYLKVEKVEVKENPYLKHKTAFVTNNKIKFLAKIKDKLVFATLSLD